MAAAWPALEPVAQAYGHSERIFDLAFHPACSDIIASASEDLTARIWCLDPGAEIYKQIHCCRGHKAEVLRVQWSEDGRLLATGSADGVVALWKPELDGAAAGSYSAEPMRRIPGHPEEVYAIEFIKGRPNLLVAGSGESLFLWDHTAGKLLQQLQAESGAMVEGPDGPEPLPAYIFSLAQHPGGTFLAGSCSDGVLRVWSCADSSLHLLQELGLHQSLGTACAFSTDGGLIFSASKAGDFVVLGFPALRVLATGTLGHPVMACTFFSAGGKQWLATAGSPQGVQLYDLLALSGTTQRTISSSSYPGGTLAVAVSADGSRLAAAGEAVPVGLLPAAAAKAGAGGAAGGSISTCAAIKPPAAAGTRRRRAAGRAVSGLAGEQQAQVQLQGLQLGASDQMAQQQCHQDMQQQAGGGDEEGLFRGLDLVGAGGQHSGLADAVTHARVQEQAAPMGRSDRAAAAASGSDAGEEVAAGAGFAYEDEGEQGMVGFQPSSGHIGRHGSGYGNGPAIRAPVLFWELDV